MTKGRQQTLDTFVPEPLFGFEEFGPTMDTPIPEAEREPVWWRRLRARGFCPRCFLEALSHGGLPEYHIDDQSRPERRDLERAILRAADRRDDLR